MRKTSFVCLSYLLLVTIPFVELAAESTVSSQSYQTPIVSKIDVIVENLPPGATFDPKIVLSKLKLHEGDPFSQITFDADLKSLSEDYDRIEPYTQVQDGKITILLKVWLRPRIRSIEWEGNRYLSTKTLQKELDIKPGAVFSRPKFNQSFNKVKELYIKKGYFESELRYELQPNPDTQEVDVLIQVREGRSGHIDDIIFKGFSKNEESDLLDMIHTKKYSLFTSWLTGTGTYNEDMLDHDKLAIYNYLQDRGYADARVDLYILESSSKGKIRIEVVADKGQIYHFGSVSFDGNHLFTDEQVEQVFIARPEGVYSPEKLRETAQAIKDLYGRKGYIETSVQYETQLAQNAPLYNVHFQIEEGDQFKIGLIRIIGNVQTEQNVILRESLLVPGEVFDCAKLKATQIRLENIGYFKNVNVYAVRTQDDIALGENYRDVYIEVTETTTGSISLFSGFSSADNIFGGLDITETNFNHRGITRVFRKGIRAVRGGGEYLHMRLSFGAKEQSFSLALMTPYFQQTLWRLGFEFNQSHSTLQSKDYDIDTYTFAVTAAYPLTPYWTYSNRYRIRDINIDVDFDSDDRKLKRAEKQAEVSNGILSAVATSLVFDSTDSALKPHRGLRSVFEGEFAGLGGNITFFRFFFLNSFYTPLWKSGIMKYRAEFRFIAPIWKTPHPFDIPLSERFFLGGVASVRGYKDFDLGPHYDKGNPTGGISSSLFSIEYLQEITKFLDLFAFMDAGSVSLEYFNPGTYRMSYGFGARLMVMNRAPFVFGFGFPVNPQNKNQVRRFFFSMGGQF